MLSGELPVSGQVLSQRKIIFVTSDIVMADNSYLTYS